jgi:hypothetical protein
MALNYSGLSFANKAINETGTNVTISIPFQSVEKVNSTPKLSSMELRNMLNDLFQSLNLEVHLTDGQINLGDKVYRFINFYINSRYDPEIWKPMLTKFSGLKVNNIRYSNGVWNYEGTIYVQ